MKSTACNLFIRINFLFFSLICGFHLVGQETKMGYTQIAKDLFLNNVKSISYKNIHFINDLPNRGSEVFVSNKFVNKAPVKIFGGFKNYIENLGISKNSNGKFISQLNSLEFENCTFDDDLRFTSMVFLGTLSFTNCKFPNQSQDSRGAYGQDFGGSVIIDSSEISALIFLDREVHPYRLFFKLNNSKITEFFMLELQKSTAELEQTKILPNDNNIIQVHDESNLIVEGSYFNHLLIGLYGIESIFIKNTTISHAKDVFLELDMDAKRVDFYKNKIDANVSLSFTSGTIYLVENKINKKLMLNFESINNSSFFDLPSLNDLDYGIMRKGNYFNASTKRQVTDDFGYRAYLRANKMLYDYFKQVGDMKSANACFVRIREIENSKLKIAFEDNPNFQNFFSLNLNRLIRIYTNYGTDPSRAIVVSFYLIFLFAILYLFFPSDWDITSKSKLVSNFKDFIKKNDKGYVKPFMQLIFGFAISFINALMLSLNAFTTLGFGNIPTKGVGRYICIIQGFIGWFLLSVFTVALFNQTQY
jgi:hypothetical protein